MQCTHGLHDVSLKWSQERIICVSLAPLTRIRSLYTRRDGTREFSEFCMLDIEFALVADKIIGRQRKIDRRFSALSPS